MNQVLMNNKSFKLSHSKKIIILIMTCVFLISTLFMGCQKDNNKELVKVNLNEVVRSIFYAPMYVAINEGFFEEEGIDIELSTGQGAEGTMAKTQVL